MSGRAVMRMLSYVGSKLRVHNPAERHQPEHEPSDGTLSNAMVHRSLPKNRCLYRFLFLNPRNRVFDFLFGQQSTLDVFLHTPLMIEEYADRQSEHPKLICHPVVTIHQDREGM